jgi:predicted amidohydrolase YtcJ
MAQQPQPASSDAKPDTIFLGRAIYTMNDVQPHAEAIAVTGGKIVAVGKAADILALKGPNTGVVDFGDKVVFPGFVEPHMHSSFTGLRPWLDIGPFSVPDMDSARQKLREAAGKLGSGQWLQAKMLDPSIMPGPTFTLADLDTIAPNVPLFILESNGHVAYVNSLALAAAKVTKDTPNPPQARFIRDANGALTGRLEETPAFYPFLAVMPQPSAADLVGYFRADLQDAIAKGCTLVHDCGIGAAFADKDLALIDAVMKTNPPLRYAGYLVSTHYDLWEKLGLKPGERAPRFTLNGIKAWADGSNQAQTGYQRDPYLGSTARGSLNYQQSEIEAVVTKAHKSGWQVGIHANGDAAIDVAIEALANGTNGEGGHQLRHRIEHCSILHDEQILKMKQLGLSPSFLIGHVHFWGRAFQDRILGPERAKRIDPCRSALDQGLRISLHSDFNVTPIDPLRCVENAVVRDMKEGGGVLAPEQCITPMEALKAVTIDAAWQCHMDHVCGSLEVGKAADLVVLERDPTKVPPQEIHAIKVLQTWIDGHTGYTA